MKKRLVYVVNEHSTKDGPRTRWTQIGVAFDDAGGSTTIKLDALPLSGTLHIRDGADERAEPHLKQEKK